MTALIRIWAVALLTFLIDQASKVWVIYGLDLPLVRVVEVFPPYLTFIMGWNRGINFGLLSDSPEWSRIILISIAIGVSILLSFWGRKADRWRMWAAFGMIIGGALGNAIDRVLYGAVADFLNMSCCGFQNPYTFNVADIFIFAGAGLLLVYGGRDLEQSKA
ncbi:signal peptidase II [Rubricella aquisinus]|uniref:Lipoprotein signal peptidase n=1 Tax=Rubricella aquisinus TaxID=2028108 RepID=A0A840WMX0_9RHOB|nr:signal peptidase II [Rubricella aquisinus]MBB5515443.1 signal peptidase II [Rubricella aquisinus]